MEETKLPTVFDTDQQQIGETYANALVGFGQKQGNTEVLLEQLTDVVGVLHKLPKLGAMMQSPGIGLAEKLGLLEKAFGGKLDANLMNFLKIVLEKGRFECVGAISSSAAKIFDELSGRVQATLTTAEPVDDSVRQRIEQKFVGFVGQEDSVGCGCRCQCDWWNGGADW